MASSTWARSADRKQTFGITRATFNRLEDFIADVEHSKEKAMVGIDMLVRLMAYTVKGIAQEKSAGPVAPRHRSVATLSGRIPVQRITGAYYAGWYIQRAGQGRYRVGNESFEALLIETGMFQRTRRPILKMSLIGMLRFIQSTRTADRFFDYVLAPRRNAKGQFQSFAKRIQGTNTMASGHYTLDTYGGSKSGKVARIERNTMAGPKSKLPG